MLNENKLGKTFANMFGNLEKPLLKEFKSANHGLVKALEEIDKYTTETLPEKSYDVIEYKKKMWEKIADEWSKSLAKSIGESFKKDVGKEMAKAFIEHIRNEADIVNISQRQNNNGVIENYEIETSYKIR